MYRKSITKEELANLPNLKIIIGNGFDLHCKVKTSYSNFFNSEEVINNNIKLLYKAICRLDGNRDLYDLFPNFCNESNLISSLCIWDIFFYAYSLEIINSSYYLEDIKWCDVESAIKNSLLKDSNSSLNWHKIYDLIITEFKNVKADNYSDNFIVLLFSTYLKIKLLNIAMNDYSDFSIFLLNELKEFEKKFGKYIKSQTNTDDYINLSSNLINELSPSSENRSSIDTFNYSEIYNSSDSTIVNHINSDYNNPIFGIESGENLDDDDLKFFTKTQRRLLLCIKENVNYIDIPFDNVIIYGHSFSEFDYGYFFSVLDKLPDNGKIIIAYSIYDEKLKDKILGDKVSSFIKLINSYESYINPSHQNRKIDNLYFSERVLFYEIKN